MTLTLTRSLAPAFNLVPLFVSLSLYVQLISFFFSCSLCLSVSLSDVCTCLSFYLLSSFFFTRISSHSFPFFVTTRYSLSFFGSLSLYFLCLSFSFFSLCSITFFSFYVSLFIFFALLLYSFLFLSLSFFPLLFELLSLFSSFSICNTFSSFLFSFFSVCFNFYFYLSPSFSHFLFLYLLCTLCLPVPLFVSLYPSLQFTDPKQNNHAKEKIIRVKFQSDKRLCIILSRISISF